MGLQHRNFEGHSPVHRKLVLPSPQTMTFSHSPGEPKMTAIEAKWGIPAGSGGLCCDVGLHLTGDLDSGVSPADLREPRHVRSL